MSPDFGLGTAASFTAIISLFLNCLGAPGTGPFSGTSVGGGRLLIPNVGYPVMQVPRP